LTPGEETSNLWPDNLIEKTMLMRICLIVAILAGLAVGALNFVMVKQKITTIQGQRENEKTAKEKAQTEASNNKKGWDRTTAELNTTKKTLDATRTERDQALANLANETKQVETIKAERDKFRKDYEGTLADIAAYKGTDLTPPQILDLKKQYREKQKNVEALLEENRTLGQKIVSLANELAIFKNVQHIVELPAGLRGKVLVCDPKYHFVILDVGRDQGVLEQGELLVHRDGKLVAKVKVRSIEKDKAVANILPGQLGEVMEGDQVIPAHPAS
jgi:hypothetical protein